MQGVYTTEYSKVHRSGTGLVLEKRGKPETIIQPLPLLSETKAMYQRMVCSLLHAYVNMLSLSTHGPG
jgi:hypothetical protein